MKSCRMMAIVFAVALTGLLLAPRARADEWNRLTRVKITGPVEVPGMVLSPGTYTFKLLNSSNRDMVEIWNADMTHLFTTVDAIPDYRMQPSGHSVFQLVKTAKNAPPELHAWFYPGDTLGEEFVYPKAHVPGAQANLLAPGSHAGE